MYFKRELNYRIEIKSLSESPVMLEIMYILLSSDEPLRIKEISEKSGRKPPQISLILRKLVEMDLVKHENGIAFRFPYYYPSTNLEKFFKGAIKRIVKKAGRMLPENREKYLSKYSPGIRKIVLKFLGEGNQYNLY